MIPSPRDLVADVVDLVPLPKAYLRIRELLRDPDVSLADLSAVIGADPGLTARLLRVANSAFLGLRPKVDTVPRAVSVLGTRQVHDLALATAAIGSLSGLHVEKAELARYWRRSIYCAVVARLLAKRSRLADPERLFVAGLLHAIGHLVLLHKQPKDLRAAIAQAIEDKRPLWDVERERFGYDYAAVGGELLGAWGLSDGLQGAVAGHTAPGLVTDHPVEASVVHLAAVLSIAAEWKSDRDEPVPDFEPGAFELVGVTPEDIDPLLAEADQQVIEAVQILIPERH